MAVGVLTAVASSRGVRRRLLLAGVVASSALVVALLLVGVTARSHNKPATLIALDTTTGRLLWRVRSPFSTIYIGPSDRGELTFLGSTGSSACDDKVAEFEVDQGTGHITRKRVGGLSEFGLRADNAVADGQHYSVNWTEMDARDALTEDFRWSAPTGNRIPYSKVPYSPGPPRDFMSVSGGSGRVAFAGNGVVQMFDKTGRRLWKEPLEGGLSPLEIDLAGGTLYVAIQGRQSDSGCSD